jgi:hypothetical protein
MYPNRIKMSLVVRSVVRKKRAARGATVSAQHAPTPHPALHARRARLLLLLLLLLRNSEDCASAQDL